MRRLLTIVFVLAAVVTSVSEVFAQFGGGEPITISNRTNDDIVVALHSISNKGYGRKTTGWDRVTPGSTITVRGWQGGSEDWIHIAHAKGKANAESKSYVAWNFTSRYFWTHIREPFEINNDYGAADQQAANNMNTPDGKSFWKRHPRGGVYEEAIMPRDPKVAKGPEGWVVIQFYKVPRPGGEYKREFNIKD